MRQELKYLGSVKVLVRDKKEYQEIQIFEYQVNNLRETICI